MKKLLSMVLCAMMALTLAGCGGSSDDSSTYTYSSELDIKNLDSSDAKTDAHLLHYMQLLMG